MFEPGGNHLIRTKSAGRLVTGEGFPVTLTLESRTMVSADVEVAANASNA